MGALEDWAVLPETLAREAAEETWVQVGLAEAEAQMDLMVPSATSWAKGRRVQTVR